jgi:hypothetical protein
MLCDRLNAVWQICVQGFEQAERKRQEKESSMLQASLAFHDFFSNRKQQEPEEGLEGYLSKPSLVCAGIN